MIGYRPDYDIQKIESDSDTIRLTTDADGKYGSDNKLVTGNYYLLVKKDGYMPVSQQIIITHIGVIRVTIDGVTDYEKIYKVYFKPYE